MGGEVSTTPHPACWRRPPSPAGGEGEMQRAGSLGLSHRVLALDDVVGDAAADLGHVVELGDEVAQALSHAAQFGDQVLALAFRQVDLDLVPAGPAVPWMEAEDLAALGGDRRGDPGGRRVGGMNGQLLDRLEQVAAALL